MASYKISKNQFIPFIEGRALNCRKNEWEWASTANPYNIVHCYLALNRFHFMKGPFNN